MALYVYVYIGGWGGESKREIISFRACVRAVLVRSPPGRFEARPGDFSSNSHGVLRKSDDKRPTVRVF